MDIVVFLEMRLNDDENSAFTATPGPWSYDATKMWLDAEAFEKYDHSKGEEYVAHGGPSPFTGCVAATGPAGHPQSMVDAWFIARHDPARVLVEIAAKRKLIDFAFTYAAEVDNERGDGHTAQQIRARECADQGGHAYMDVLRLLALPFADHPDFDESWRP